jgi:hypothetical protein
VSIIEDISRGEILYEASKHALAVMKGFQDQQVGRGGVGGWCDGVFLDGGGGVA